MSAAVPTQNRIGAEPARESTAAARLALAEILLFSDDPIECCRATVDWLAQRSGARKAICALIQGDSGTLQHVAASGVPEGQLESLHLALGEPDHPLVFALSGRDPVTLGKGTKRNGSREDPWRTDFLAIPLPLSEKREARQGLLLVSLSEGSDLLFELLSSVVQHPREGTCVVSILRNVIDLPATTEKIE